MLENWTPPNSTYPPPKPGEPPLHRAARLGDGDAIRALIQAGADPNAAFDLSLDPGACPNPASPLMVAAGSGDGADAATVARLIELGANPALMLKGRSAANFAVGGLGWNYRPGGDTERLRLVLKAGTPLPADPDIANRMVCDAAGSGDADRLGILLEHGLNAQGHWDSAKAQSDAARTMRGMSEHGAFSKDLFEGMPEDMTASLRQTMNDLYQQMSDKMASAPSSLEIPLFRAAESGNADCVRLLLDAGADPQARDSSQRTAMYYASSTKVARELINAGLSIEELDEFEWTPLVSAVTDGEHALSRTRALIDVGANVNAVHDNGYTVFMSAVGSGRHIDVLRLLIATGANPHVVTDLGYNAYHAAIDVSGEANEEQSVRSTFDFLKELGVNIEHRNSSDQTPLARAISAGNSLEVQVLCDLGADPNAVALMARNCDESETECNSESLPLLFHAVSGPGVHKTDKVESLLKAGADPLAEDRDGNTPLMHAIASLAENGTNYEELFTNIALGLHPLRYMHDTTLPPSRDAFIEQVSPTVRAEVVRLASGIPLSHVARFADEWRNEAIVCITALCVAEAFAHRQQHERPNP